MFAQPNLPGADLTCGRGADHTRYDFRRLAIKLFEK
jgi:hypothetical protein